MSFNARQSDIPTGFLEDDGKERKRMRHIISTWLSNGLKERWRRTDLQSRRTDDSRRVLVTVTEQQHLTRSIGVLCSIGTSIGRNQTITTKSQNVQRIAISFTMGGRRGWTTRTVDVKSPPTKLTMSKKEVGRAIGNRSTIVNSPQLDIETQLLENTREGNFTETEFEAVEGNNFVVSLFCQRNFCFKKSSLLRRATWGKTRSCLR